MAPLEQTVLDYTRSRKSSYGGQNRYQMARSDYRYRGRVYGGAKEHGDTFPPESEWNAAKDRLIARGLLDKRGAITVAGKNAARSV